MGENLTKLISISGDQFAAESNVQINQLLENAGPLGVELFTLLKQKNGFFAFESALRVFPLQTSGASIGIVDWNAPDLWRGKYDSMASGCLFFAEDIFGQQFCIKGDAVFIFDPETGESSEMASDLDDWARQILTDFNFWTGHALAHEWQVNNSLLSKNERLMPVIPFVAGGSFAVENLRQIEAVQGMNFRANIARQIADLPDGAQIEFKIID